MNRKGFGRNPSCFNRGCIPECVCRDWGKQWKTSACPVSYLLFERIASRLPVTAGRGRSSKHSDLLCQDDGYVSYRRRVYDQKKRGFFQWQFQYSGLVVCYAVSPDKRLSAVQRSVMVRVTLCVQENSRLKNPKLCSKLFS